MTKDEVGQIAYIIKRHQQHFIRQRGVGDTVAYFEVHRWRWNRSVAVHRHPGRRSEEVNTHEAAEMSLEAALGECTRGVCNGNLYWVGQERAFFLVTKFLGERRSCTGYGIPSRSPLHGSRIAILLHASLLVDILIVEWVVVGCGSKLTLSSPNVTIGTLLTCF